jgi:hypothetical protein
MATRGDVEAALASTPEGMGLRVLFVSAAIFVFLVLCLSPISADELPVQYFLKQDRLVLLFGTAALGAVGLMGRRSRVPALPAWGYVVQPVWRWWAVLSLVALLLWWGTYALMFNYPLTRDEHMVVFDMAVFAKGHLAEPLAPFWRPYAESLAPAFLLQENHPAGLVSSYLPGNAAMRLAFSRIADPALLNPLLAAIGGLALLDVARREFRDDPAAVVLVMVLYLTSTQVLATAMTNYAMTAHLAFNLVWLAAFLRGGRVGHGVAIVVGAYACGLHQIVFHPLFAGPFLLWRLTRGEWRIVLVYGAAYAAAGVAWILYPTLAAAQAAVPGVAAANADFLERVLPLLLERDPNTMLLMTYNLSRFLSWQNLALLPLVIAAWPAIRSNRGIAAPLFGGLLLTIVAVGFVLLPYQGHGWGYRYLHGFIGSAALLGGYGLVNFRRYAKGAKEIVALLTLLTVFVSMPWLLFQAHRFVAPFVRIDRLMAAQRTPFVLVDTYGPPKMIDQVRNLPNLSNYPIRLSSRTMTPAMVAAVCQRGEITLITRDDMHRQGIALQIPAYSARFEKLLRSVSSPSCFHSATDLGTQALVNHGVLPVCQRNQELQGNANGRSKGNFRSNCGAT